MKKTLIKMLTTAGFKETSINIFNTLDKNNIHLKDIKYIIETSKKLKNSKLLEKYISLALELYPENSYGYLQYAHLEMAKKEYKKAYDILKKAPSTKEGKAILNILKNKLDEKEEKPVVKKPVEKKPVEKKPVAKKPVEKKPVAKKPVEKKPVEISIKYLKDFEEEERDIMVKLIPDPLNTTLHEALVDLYLYFDKKTHISKFMNTFIASSDIRTLSAIFKRSNLYQLTGNYISSLECLTNAQKKYTGDRRVLFKISEIYKYDRQNQRAYIMIRAGELDNPTYGAIRRLSFEVDALLLDSAKETLEKILKYKLTDLSRYMNMINRVSAYLPEYNDQLILARINVEKELKHNIFRNEKYFNSRAQYLLGGRYVKDLDTLLSSAVKKGIIVNDDTINWYNKIKKFLDIDEKGSFLGWINIANQNESSKTLIGIDKGLPVATDDKKLLNKKTIEVFIPNSIFTNPQNDKDSFQTVNNIFKEIFLFLLRRDDIIIIPRHQYNWRYCVPGTTGKIISYHTHHHENNPNWLHIQESTFSDYCSVDTKGFAGYADIASNFQKIDLQVQYVSNALLNANYRYLHNKYIKQNISKYKQDEIKFTHKGEYVFVALQVLTDVVADLADIDGISLVETVANAYKNSNTKVIVKRHPYCNSISLQRMVEKLENAELIEQTNASIHSIIEGSRAVFTVNSGVGLESLMHLKPVVVSGGCDYAYGVYAQVKTTQELESIIEENNFSIDKHRILKFLYFYTKFYIKDQSSIRDTLSTWIK